MRSKRSSTKFDRRILYRADGVCRRLSSAWLLRAVRIFVTQKKDVAEEAARRRKRLRRALSRFTKATKEDVWISSNGDNAKLRARERHAGIPEGYRIVGSASGGGGGKERVRMSSQNSEEDLRGGSRNSVLCRLARCRVFSWVAENARGDWTTGSRLQIRDKRASRPRICFHKANVFVYSLYTSYMYLRVIRIKLY